MAGKKRVRNVPLYGWVSPEELQAIRARMEQTGIRNMSAYIRKMALNGYVLQVDLSPVRELVSLQRRCANNLNQAALHVNTYGGLYQNELQALQKDSIKVRGALAERCAAFAYKGCKLAASGDFETICFAEDPSRQPGFLIKATEVEFLSPRKVEEAAGVAGEDGSAADAA